VEDEKYLLVRDDPRFFTQKNIMNQMWQSYEQYADPNFQNQLAIDFHARFWELYMGFTFIFLGYQLKKKSKSDGPDICLELPKNRGKVWIELVAPTAGEGDDRVPDFHSDEYSPTPEPQFLFRFTASILDKNLQLQKYLNAGIGNATDFFVIGINGLRVTQKVEDYPPYIYQSLYGKINHIVNIDTTKRQIASESFQVQKLLRKANQSPVSSFSFQNREYPNITGVLYSDISICDISLDHIYGSDLAFIHNKTTLNPLKTGWLMVGTEF
jgi:hypothetical protein